MLVFLNLTYSLPFASHSACENPKTPWQDFSPMMRTDSPRNCPPRRRKPLPKRTQPRSEITVGWACYVPGATAVDSLNFPTQIQRPHQAGSRGLRSWTKRSSVSGKRQGRGDGSTREWGWGSQVPGWDQTLPLLLLLFHSKVEKRPLGPFKPHSRGPEG